MRLPFFSKLNDKVNLILQDLNSLGDDLIEVLTEANQNIANSLKSATEDIKTTSENIAQSADSISDTLNQTALDIKTTAESISKSADSIGVAVKDFTRSTTETINRFESAIERSVERLVSTIEDFKNEIVQGGIKVNIAKSASSLMPRPQTGFMQGITSGIRDMIIPKRKGKNETDD
ncbi:MAG: hypothetical protein ACTSQQ_02575 [Candidatus Helarchaeota archaeon]